MRLSWWQIFLFPVGFFLALFFLSFFSFYFYNLIKYRHLPPSIPRLKNRSLFLRLFWDFPRQYWHDRWHRSPDDFNEYGFRLICGEQGSGKTMTLAYLLRQTKRRYPNCKIATNFNYVGQDSAIEHWRDIVFHNNGTLGQVDVIDEVQTWFSSQQSKDFPPEMLSEVSQQRKQRKVIYGTAQVFNRVAKPIREQVDLLYEPFTVAGCLTIVKVSKPKIDDQGSVEKKKFRKIFFFVQSKELRESFDTYYKIKGLALQGFQRPAWLESVGASIPPDGGK